MFCILVLINDSEDIVPFNSGPPKILISFDFEQTYRKDIVNPNPRSRQDWA